MNNNSRKGVKRFFVWPDTQIPEHDATAVMIALKRLREFKPDYFINIGDFVDNTPLLGQRKAKHFELSPRDISDLRSQWDIANRILDVTQAELPKGCMKVFMMGNHEDRGYEILDGIRSAKERRDLEYLLDPEVAMGLKDRGYLVKEYNTTWKLGKLYFTHGAFHNQAHARKHIMEFQKSICYGHMHTIDIETHHTPVREVSLMGICVGCLSNLNPAYKKNIPAAYDHAFAEGYIARDGSFWIYINRIIKGKLVAADGKTYGRF